MTTALPTALPTGLPSLYERLGGTYGIAGAVDVLVDRLYNNTSANRNPAVAEFHALHGQAGFKFYVTAWSIEKTGGPACYPGRDMTAAHAHLAVTDTDFDIVATEIAATLHYVGVPTQEHREFMAIIESYRPQVVSIPAQVDRSGSIDDAVPVDDAVSVEHARSVETVSA